MGNGYSKILFPPRTMATRIEDYYKEDEVSYKKRILKMGKMKTVEKTRKMKKVKTRKRDNFLSTVMKMMMLITIRCVKT